MRVRRVRNAWSRPGAGGSVERDVREILDHVRREGDDAVLGSSARFDRAELRPDELRVDPRELEASLGVLEPDVLRGLRAAIANVRAVAEAQLAEPAVVELDAGQRVEVLERPVRRVGVYVPGGRAAYPSSVVMCAVTARAAGVEQIAVCAPPGPGGRAHPAILAACVLCEVNEVYRMGGAQAVGALAYGTASVPAVDVIVGPGNAYVQEAKRQLVGVVGIDGIAGPSELAVVAGEGADAELVALDLLAQAEHGAESPLWLLSPHEDVIESVTAAVGRLAEERPSVADAELEAVLVEDIRRRPCGWPTRSPPSTWSWWATRRRRSPTPSAPPAASSSALRRAPPSATTWRGPTRASHRRRRALPGRPLPGHLPAAHGQGFTAGRGGRPPGPSGRPAGPRRGLPVHAESMERRT